MRSSILFLIALFISCAAFAQDNPFKITFDHQAIMVSNLGQSADFYHEILGLEEIDNKTGKSHIRWFSLGEDKSIHLIEGDDKNIRINKTIHLALSLPDLDAFVKHLESKNIEYWDWPGEKGVISTRADGALQVYIQDPDGYWIEINNDL